MTGNKPDMAVVFNNKDWFFKLNFMADTFHINEPYLQS